MFPSPLGAPASYAAIDLTPKTLAAIKQGLHQAIPRVMAAGSNKVTGQNRVFDTSPKLQLSPEVVKNATARIIKDYSVKVLLKSLN